MIQDVHVKWNPELPWQKQHSTPRKPFFNQQIWLKFEEETSKVLHLEHRFVWCWNVDIWESGSEVSGKFWDLVLEKNGEDQLDRSCEKWRSITGLDRPLGLQELETPRISRQSAHKKWQVCQPHTPAAFTARRYFWYSFLLETKSTSRP
jgi:hypothetical protein